MIQHDTYAPIVVAVDHADIASDRIADALIALANCPDGNISTASGDRHEVVILEHPISATVREKLARLTDELTVHRLYLESSPTARRSYWMRGAEATS